MSFVVSVSPDCTVIWSSSLRHSICEPSTSEFFLFCHSDWHQSLSPRSESMVFLIANQRIVGCASLTTTKTSLIWSVMKSYLIICALFKYIDMGKCHLQCNIDVAHERGATSATLQCATTVTKPLLQVTVSLSPSTGSEYLLLRLKTSMFQCSSAQALKPGVTHCCLFLVCRILHFMFPWMFLGAKSQAPLMISLV